MPRTLRIVKSVSPRFPRFEILFADVDEAPELDEESWKATRGLNRLAWRLHLARRRQSREKKLSEALRDRILCLADSLRTKDGEPVAIYGFRLNAPRGTETKITDQHSDEVTDSAGFITYLGKHADQIITGAKIPLSSLVSDAHDFEELVNAIARTFGNEAASKIQLNFDSDALKKLIKEGQLPEIPDEVMSRVVGSKQVRVTPVAGPK